MQNLVASVLSEESESLDAGRCAGEAVVAQFGATPPKMALVYATMNHDHDLVLEGLRAAFGPGTLLLGCSVQGVVSNEQLTEDGYAVGVMAFGGALDCAAAVERDIQNDPREKGRALAQTLKRDLGCDPKVIVLLYDPLCGADVEAILEGVRLETDCPVIGGAAGQPWGPPCQTFQYWDQEVFSHGAVAVALSGSFGVEVGICHGTAPTGIASVVTKAAGNQVVELDGRSAIEVWRETTGCQPEEMVRQSHLAAWAFAVELTGSRGEVGHVIRGAFGFDEQTGGVVLQAAVAEGSRVMLHHRTIDRVLSGTKEMGRELSSRLDGHRPLAVLGFECAARTFPFLGETNTREEHVLLRATVATDAPWLGMMAWGEIGPCAGRSAFHNYTYPLLVLTEKAA